MQESRRPPYNTDAMTWVESGKCGFVVEFIISVIPFRKAQKAGVAANRSAQGEGERAAETT